MHFTAAIAIASLLAIASALPTQTASPSTVANAIYTPIPVASTAHLEIRQGVAVTAAPVAATDIPGQVSPITTVQIGVVKNGIYTVIYETYTQTFNTPIDQWPAATAGAIGLGTIVGTVGVVKTKRDIMPLETQLPVPLRDVLTLEELREMMNERPIEDETKMETRNLVLTTESLDKLMAAQPIEDATGEKKRDLVLTRELLNEVMGTFPAES